MYKQPENKASCKCRMLSESVKLYAYVHVVRGTPELLTSTHALLEASTYIIVTQEIV